MLLSNKNGATLVLKPCREETVYVTSGVVSATSVTSNSHVSGWRLSVFYLLLVLLLVSRGCVSALCSVPGWSHQYPWFLRFNLSQLNFTGEQGRCLIATEDSIDEICQTPSKMRAERIEKVRDARTNFCGLPLINVLSPEERANVFHCGRKRGCRASVQSLVRRDSDVRDLYCAFTDAIERYDCNEDYSVVGNCTKCKAVYKEWLCSVYLDYYHGDRRVLPCIDFCQEVAQFCPFFRPEVQVGEPGFLCKDQYIEQNSSLLYGQSGCCIKPCQAFGPSENCAQLNLTTTCFLSNGAGTQYHNCRLLAYLTLSLLASWVHRTVLKYACIGMT